MKKAEAFDIIVEIVLNGVNCWECQKGDEEKNIAYLTGIVEALHEATKDETD